MQISDFFIPGDVLEDDSDFDNIPGTQIQRERGGGAMGCLLHLFQKFYNNVFLYVGLTSLLALLYFDWLIHLVEFQTLQPL